MKEYLSIFKINNTQSVNPQIRLILLNFFVFFLPFERFYSTFLIFPIVLLVILDFKRLAFKRLKWKLMIFQTVWILSLLGYFFATNKSTASFLIEKQLMIFIFPLLLPIAFDINSKNLKSLMISLILGSFTALLILFSYTLSSFINSSDFVFSNHLNHYFSSPISIHPTYLSIYICFAIACLLIWGKNIRDFHKYLTAILLLVVFLLVGIIFLSSRNITIITFILIAILTYPLFKKKISYLISLLCCGVIMLTFVLSNNFLKERFGLNLISEVNLSKSRELLEPRSERWKVAFELVKESPLIGYGTGDEEVKLKEKYLEHKMFISYIEGFNAHNQFLSILIKHGIIGLIIFILAFAYYVKIGVKSRNKEYLLFLSILFFAFMTENILDSNKGIFFFAFFNTVFGYYSLSLNDLKAKNRPIIWLSIHQIIGLKSKKRKL